MYRVTIVLYQDDKLGFRPWYADGFVYCPNCNKPLRHHEEYAIDRPAVQKEMTVSAFVWRAAPSVYNG